MYKDKTKLKDILIRQKNRLKGHLLTQLIIKNILAFSPVLHCEGYFHTLQYLIKLIFKINKVKSIYKFIQLSFHLFHLPELYLFVQRNMKNRKTVDVSPKYTE